jgi:hypothetical protein
MHLATVGANYFQRHFPGRAQTLHIRYNAGRCLLIGFRANEKKWGHSGTMALFPHSGCSKLHTLELFTPAKFKLRHYPKTALRTVTLEELPGLQVDRHGRLHGAAPTHAAPEV